MLADDIALTGGSWTLVAGILRWQPIQKERRDGLAIVCSTCNARYDEHCITRNGGYITDHVARTMPRGCRCGAPVQGKRTYCEDCRIEVRRATWREAQRMARSRLVDSDSPCGPTRIDTEKRYDGGNSIDEPRPRNWRSAAGALPHSLTRKEAASA